MHIRGEEGFDHFPRALRQGSLRQRAGFLHHGSLHRVGQLIIRIGRELGGVVRAPQFLLNLSVVHGRYQPRGGKAPPGPPSAGVLHVAEHCDLILAHVLDAPGIQLLFHEKQLRRLLHGLIDAPQGDAALLQRLLNSRNHFSAPPISPAGCGPSYTGRRRTP